MEAASGIEPLMEVLQTSALPLGYAAVSALAGNEILTNGISRVNARGQCSAPGCGPVLTRTITSYAHPDILGRDAARTGPRFLARALASCAQPHQQGVVVAAPRVGYDPC
jgi:hypothetical protein